MYKVPLYILSLITLYLTELHAILNRPFYVCVYLIEMHSILLKQRLITCTWPGSHLAAATQRLIELFSNRIAAPAICKTNLLETETECETETEIDTETESGLIA